VQLADFLKRVDELIRQGDAVLATRQQNEWAADWVDEGVFSGFRAAALSFLKNLYGSDHPYFRDFDQRCDANDTDKARAGREILASVKAELTGGWLVTARGLLSAEIFADFLEMSAYLLEQKYKDAAAVIAGSVLEEQLRQLCATHGIPSSVQKGADLVPKKADTLNAELAGANVYNKLDQKNVTAWLDLRNKAAHGKYGEYTIQQVEHMQRAITEFMARHTV
jgi:hypothetical protein